MLSVHRLSIKSLNVPFVAQGRPAICPKSENFVNLANLNHKSRSNHSRTSQTKPATVSRTTPVSQEQGVRENTFVLDVVVPWGSSPVSDAANLDLKSVIFLNRQYWQKLLPLVYDHNKAPVEKC